MTDLDAAASEVEAPSPRAFFDRGDRKMHLDQLRHLSQWSRRILLVTGAKGIGKSALYRQLSATLEPRAKAARINGTLVSGTREVLNAMVQGFGLAAPADADTQLLRQLIAEHAAEQEQSDRFCVALIDDAELLEFRALEQLVALVHASPLRLVLFGEIRVVPALERAADAARVGWHEIRLSGFNVDDARSYLQWRFEQQGYATDEVPFSETQVRDIVRLSEGVPGRIDQMTDALLARMQAGAASTVQRFPALHRAILAVLVVAVAFLYLIWRPGDEAPADTDAPSITARPPALPDTAPRDAALDEPTDREPTDGASLPDPAPGTPQGGLADEGEPQPATADAIAAADEQARSGAAVESAQSPVAERSAAATAVDGPAESTDGGGAVAAADPPPPVPADSAQQREAAAAGAVQPEPAPAKAAAVPAEAADDMRDPTWIMRQPAASYTLQLVSFSTAERAEAYLEEQDDPGQFALYRLQREGRILHVVIYGSFTDRAAAERAAGDLPDGVGNVQPWIRTFSAVQSAIRTALQS